MLEGAGVKFTVVFLGKEPPSDDRARRLLYWGARLGRLGVTPELAGNLSFRTEEGFVITGAGVSLGAIMEEQLVQVTRVEEKEGKTVVYARGVVPPSSESVLHWVIYRLRPPVNAIFHTHDGLVLKFGDRLGIPATARERPWGSPELAKEARELLQRDESLKYFILKNHGVVALGGTPDEAGRLTEAMNRRAQAKLESQG